MYEYNETTFDHIGEFQLIDNSGTLVNGKKIPFSSAHERRAYQMMREEKKIAGDSHSRLRYYTPHSRCDSISIVRTYEVKKY